eukprot:SAG11_NODE_44_length_20765_cov_5.183635_13_plen_180_part_00
MVRSRAVGLKLERWELKLGEKKKDLGMQREELRTQIQSLLKHPKDAAVKRAQLSSLSRADLQQQAMEANATPTQIGDVLDSEDAQAGFVELVLRLEHDPAGALKHYIRFTEQFCIRTARRACTFRSKNWVLWLRNPTAELCQQLEHNGGSMLRSMELLNSKTKAKVRFWHAESRLMTVF